MCRVCGLASTASSSTAAPVAAASSKAALASTARRFGFASLGCRLGSLGRRMSVSPAVHPTRPSAAASASPCGCAVRRLARRPCSAAFASSFTRAGSADAARSTGRVTSSCPGCTTAKVVQRRSSRLPAAAPRAALPAGCSTRRGARVSPPRLGLTPGSSFRRLGLRRFRTAGVRCVVFGGPCRRAQVECHGKRGNDRQRK